MELREDVRRLMADIAAWQKAEGVPPRAEQSPADMRAIYTRQSALRAEGAVPPVAEERDATVPTRAGPRRVKVFRPDAAGPMPVLVYVHGGGYVIGGIDETEAEARRLAAAVPATLVSISYRFAPEHPFPAAIEDVEDQVRAVAAGAVPGVPAGPVGLAGVSAGAGLAVAAAKRLMGTEAAPAFLVLLSPCLDLTGSSPSAEIFARGYMLERETMRLFAALYLPEGVAPDHPDVSPARHPVPPGFPPTIQCAAACDPLADDAALFARRLAEAGVDNHLDHVAGVTHGFHTWYARLPSVAPDLARLHARIALAAAETGALRDG